MAELVETGEAIRVGTGHYRLTKQGHDRIGAIMRRNSERWIEWRSRSQGTGA